MPLKIDDLGLERFPSLPEELPIFELSAPPFADRRTGIARLSEFLRLGDLRAVEMDHGLVLAGERGEIEYFHASGAVWARDAPRREQRDELPQVGGHKEVKGGKGPAEADAAGQLLAQAWSPGGDRAVCREAAAGEP
jgi:hypothetical protein